MRYLSVLTGLLFSCISQSALADIGNDMATIIGSVITAVTMAIVAIIGWIREANQRKRRVHSEGVQRVLEDRLDGITRPIKVEKGHKRNSIMLLGIGGAGKTSLIRTLFDNPAAKPEDATENYDMYRISISTKTFRQDGALEGKDATSNDAPQGEKCTLFIGDYRGQNLGTLVRTFVLQQKMSYHPMAYGYINTLILVVDIIPPPPNRDGPFPEPQAEADTKRVRVHNQEWNDTALDAIFGLLTRNSLSHICLFINKFDLITDSSAESERKIIKKFQRVASRLRERANGAGASFEILLGSAKTGAQVNPLKRKIIANSVADQNDTVQSSGM